MARWWGFFVFMFAICLVLTDICNEEFVMKGDVEDASAHQTYSIIEYNQDQNVDVISTVEGLWDKSARMLTWNYPFLEGSWSFVRWFILIPLNTVVILLTLMSLGSYVFGV